MRNTLCMLELTIAILAIDYITFILLLMLLCLQVHYHDALITSLCSKTKWMFCACVSKYDILCLDLGVVSIMCCVNLGDYDTAMKAAQDIQYTLPVSLITDPFLSTYFESFFSMNVHVLIRFGRWNELLQLEVPTDVEV